jgi:myo-inositol-1-phosphate synthase
MTHSKKVRVAIIGVGNCASSLVQGVHYYRDAKAEDFVPGLMHVEMAGYHVNDIEFTAAFDIDKNKVGKDINEAIYTAPNKRHQRDIGGTERLPDEVSPGAASR